MASEVRKARVKEVPLSEIKDDPSRFVREAETREIVITRRGKPEYFRAPAYPARRLASFVRAHAPTGLIPRRTAII